MKTSFGKWAVCASLLCAGVAFADEKEADDCLRSKIWSGYDEGWAVRTATTTTLKAEEHRVYLVTLYEGNEYKISVCGDKNIANVDVVLHNANGDELKRDESTDREPIIIYTPSETDTYYVAVYAAQLAEGKSESGVAMAVTYR